MKVLTIAAALFFVVVNCFAGNPADLTTNHRSSVSEFYKIAYDGGPRWTCVNLPLGETVNGTFFNWQDNETSFTQLIIVKKFYSWFDGAVDSTLDEGGPAQNVVGSAILWSSILI